LASQPSIATDVLVTITRPADLPAVPMCTNSKWVVHYGRPM